MGARRNIDLLILGPGRGGTSLLAALIDAHPQLTVEIELHSIACLLQTQKSWWPQPQFKLRTNRFFDKCRKSAKQNNQKKYWGNKITTEQLRDLHTLNPQKGLSYFLNKIPPQTKILFIMRDGRSCIPSKIKRGNKTLEEAIDLYKFADFVYDKLESVPQPKFSLRYEDLIENPENTLRKVCDFLNLNYGDDLLRGTQSKKLHPEYQNPEIIKSKLQLSEPQVWHARIEEVQKKWGYS